MVPNTSSSSCFRFIILVSVVLSSVVVIADMSTTTAAVLPPYVTLNVSSPRPPPFNVTATPATATMVPPPPPGFQQAETQADGNSAYVAELTVYPYANLAGNATLALMRFPFNRSLALATYNTLLPTTTSTPAQTTTNAALPQSVEVLASSPSDFVIHDVSVDTDTDTVYLATAGGIFSYVDNYRHALQHLPEGWPTGLVTAVAGLVRVTLLGVNLFAANNVQTDPLHTPFQNEAVAAVVYDASVLAVTVKGLPCTSLSVTDTRPAGLPGYVATVTCTVVQPAAVDVGSLRGRDVVLTVANKGSASGAQKDLQPYTTAAAMDAARVAAGGRPFLVSASWAAQPFSPQMVVVRSAPAPAASATLPTAGRAKWLYWANLDVTSGLSTVYTSDLTGLNPSPVLAAVPALAQFTYLTVPVAAYVAAVGSDTAKAQAAAASSIAARVGRKPSPTAPAPAPAEAAGTTGVTVDVFFLVSGARGGSLSVYLNPASYSGPVEAATAAALAAANANTPTDVTPLVINLSTANRPTAVSVDPDLAHGYVFVALLDGRVLRMTLGPLLALKAAAALGLGPSPVVDVAAGPLPAWAVFITAAHATARQGYVYSLPYLPPTAATGNIQPPTTAPAAYLQPLPRPREWTQMRLVTIDTNRHLLDVFGDRGGPLQVDKVTGMPNPHTARSQIDLYRAGIVWPRALFSWQSTAAVPRPVISCVVPPGNAADAGPLNTTTTTTVSATSACGGAPGTNVTVTEHTVTLHVYIAEAFGKVWRLDMHRNTDGYITTTGATLTPTLVVDRSQFPASQRMRTLLFGLMAGRATSDQPPLSFELL